MDTTTLLQSAKTLLVPWTERIETPEINRLDVFIPPASVYEAVQTLFLAGGWYLSAITGLDSPPTESSEGGIELLYHICQGPAIVSLRVLLPYSKPEVASICKIIPSASLYERELIEMLGVVIPDSPLQTKLLLPDDWPDSIYPLRKSFTGLDQS